MRHKGRRSTRTVISHFRTAAFSLVEVTIALAIVTFAMVVMLGILPAGLNLVRESSDESAASNILSGVAADIRNLPETSDTTTLYAIPVRQGTTTTSGTFHLGASGAPAVSAADAYYAVIWTVMPPTGSTGNPRQVHVGVSWPANARDPMGTVETIVGAEKQNP